MLDSIVHAVSAIAAGLVFGLALGGTKLIPRRGEAEVFWLLFLTNVAFAAVYGGFDRDAMDFRATYYLFAVAVALGAYLRRIVVARRRLRRRAANVVPFRSRT
jgi:hypothetical protein